MLVENAERFGLAQLHQLRGRVGRGRRRSRCVLLYGAKASPESRERLAVLEKTDDGFVVAEEDLKRRGPGDALGTRQSGVPLFRVGDLVRDVQVDEGSEGRRDSGSSPAGTTRRSASRSSSAPGAGAAGD